jgi:hypothetical protein
MHLTLPYLEGIAGVPGATSLISELCYHRYGEQSVETAKQIGQRAQKLNVKTAMLERMGADYRTLHEDLKFANVSSWMQFTLAFWNPKDNGGKLYIVDLTDPANPKLKLSRRAKMLRQYFRYIEPGAVRVEARSDKKSVDPVAFINRDGKFVIVVKVESSADFEVHGIPAGKYGITFTTRTKYNRQLNDRSCSSGCVIRATMPKPGVMTIYGK